MRICHRDDFKPQNVLISAVSPIDQSKSRSPTSEYQNSPKEVHYRPSCEPDYEWLPRYLDILSSKYSLVNHLLIVDGTRVGVDSHRDLSMISGLFIITTEKHHQASMAGTYRRLNSTLLFDPSVQIL